MQTSTFGRPCVLLAAFAALMPPVMLSILPLIGAWKPSSVASTGSPIAGRTLSKHPEITTGAIATTSRTKSCDPVRT
jgi:hypothetical protein